MSEPITLTERPELDALIAAAVAVAEAMSPEERAAMMEAQRQSWVRGEQGLRRPTESASPPRVPGANAQPLKVGVESGPGQPIDICERMNRARDCVPGAELRMLLADGEMEIRRLRGIVDECQEAAGIPADQAEDYCTVSSLIADKVVELEDRARTERRAGIEAAACEVDRLADEEGLLPHHFSAAIRALADKPAPDAARKGG